MSVSLDVFAQELIELGDRLQAAVEEGDWTSAERLDAELNRRLRALSPVLLSDEPGHRAIIARCLTHVQRCHQQAMEGLMAARDQAGRDLAGMRSAHRGAGQYLATAGN